MKRLVWNVSVDVVAPSTMNRTEVVDMLDRMIKGAMRYKPLASDIPDNVDFQVGFTKFICEEGEGSNAQ